MTDRGRVREIQGNSITIAPEKGAACFGCMNQECKSGGGLIAAENPENLDIKTGQLVEAEAPGFNFIVQALTAFLPPILGFIAGYALTRLLLPRAGEGAAAAGGIVLLFAASFVVLWIRRKKPAPRVFKVTKIVD